VIAVRGLRFAHPGGRPVFSGLDLDCGGGLVHALIGPSGCGKTTLVYLLAGLLVPGAGSVAVAGAPAAKGRRGTAVILQDHGLFPWLTVEANLALGLELRGRSRPAIRAKTAAALAELGLNGYERRYPRQLSGGERQRLAIGRALVLDPDLLLLDEPFSSLDAMTRERLQDRLAAVARAGGDDGHGSGRRITTVIVTHSIEEAVFLADRIHVMAPGGSVATIANAPGGPDYRSRPEFFAACVAARSALAAAMSAGGAAKDAEGAAKDAGGAAKDAGGAA
jgi:NitT/TauT family transport system ATP-binding protein